MSWIPPGELRSLLDKVVTRARESALVDFDKTRRQIEAQQAARGVMGGMVAHRCIAAAGDAIKLFANTAVADLIETLEQGQALSRDSLAWVRDTVNATIDALVRGLGAHIDGLKTTGGLKNNAGRLDQPGREAKRDADIVISRSELRAPKPSPRPLGPMYHLLVSGSEHAWSGSPMTYTWDRVLEYSDEELKRRFKGLDADAVSALLALPCLFVYEAHPGKAPLFGRLTAITPRSHNVRLEYEIVPVRPFLTADDVPALAGALGVIHGTELNHTHWAIKEVDLARVLAERGIELPSARRPRVNIETHRFDVALSFPGEKRVLVRQIAERLEQLLGPNTVFYDDFYPGELAQPRLDTLLQNIYGKRSSVLVVVAGTDYQRKNWCGLEFQAIKEHIMARENRKVMIIRTDDGEVDGIFSTDGYLDARRFTAGELAGMIAGRADELRAKS